MAQKPTVVFEELLSHYGPQGWWPVSDTEHGKAVYKKRGKPSEHQQFEVCVGAILTQNTAWKNVEKAIHNLKQQQIFSLQKIAKAKPDDIAQAIKPSGYFNQKTKRLQHFCQHFLHNFFSVSAFLKKEKTALRKELLSLHGIGPETADSIILYASQQPVFVVDAYTKRFVHRFYGKKTAELTYEKTQGFFESQLPHSVKLFNEYHALLVEHGKRYCKVRPNCANCFLKQTCRVGKSFI